MMNQQVPKIIVQAEQSNQQMIGDDEALQTERRRLLGMESAERAANLSRLEAENARVPVGNSNIRKLIKMKASIN